MSKNRDMKFFKSLQALCRKHKASISGLGHAILFSFRPDGKATEFDIMREYTSHGFDGYYDVVRKQVLVKLNNKKVNK